MKIFGGGSVVGAQALLSPIGRRSKREKSRESFTQLQGPPFGGRVTEEADVFLAFCTPARSPASLRQIEHAAILQFN